MSGSFTSPPMRLTRIDPARNMARFYELHLQPTLFGETSLIRRWGRIGGEGRALVETHASDEAAQDALARWRKRKEGRGYAPWSGCSERGHDATGAQPSPARASTA